jgi:sigma-E factor negative regulatory protein RseC
LKILNTINLIEERAEVLAAADGFAVVETHRTAACGSCSQTGGCGNSLLASVFGSRASRIRVLNPVNARPGERVVIGLKPNMLVKASLIVYLLPLSLLLLSAVTGEAVARYLGIVSTEIFAIFCGLFGLLAGLAWLRHLSQASLDAEAYQAVILRVEAGGGVAVDLADKRPIQ